MRIIKWLYPIYLGLVVLLTFFLELLLALVSSLFAKDKFQHFQNWARAWSKSLVFFSGLRLTVKGLENLQPGKNYIFASNHQGLADIPIVLAALPVNFHFVIKSELFRIPIFGWYLRLANYIPVERASASSAFESLKSIAALLKQGHSILFFPEGTRSKDGKLGSLKRGSLKAAYDSGAPVLPVGISGSFDLLRPGSLVFKPSKITVALGKPLHFAKTESTNREQMDRDLEKLRNALAALI